MPQAFWGTQSAGAAAWGAAAAASSGRFGSSLRKRCGQVPPDPTLESPFEEMALVKGGWLWRQSSILRRWKRNWFALWLDGTLGYYHDETAQDEEDRVLIQFNIRDIKIGQECHDVQPPEGRSRDGLLTVNLREGSRLHLCAETKDDAIAWKTALLEASSTPVRVYSPYQDYYEVVPPNAHEATYIRSYYGPPYAGPGVTHVVVREDPCYSAGAPLAMGMLAGAATGAALGSLMWSPCWF
ncbi:pleckstrin homology domain-containing family B member 1 isoform X4 [Phoca vitulina]|uniref:pleckstrin homology domain-containing family B member 1 isoform X4 n=1 Tax=Phoca vitulina TaxID=9720 RepID=UPI001396052C|nr:pleckstrin homology domain-containing family B member 1 isoform X4 [Phoca vitulina]XP_035975391.1 pleckstrin homology domain-containing family B member 1 isoform X4 [Halichoerus grypus]